MSPTFNRLAALLLSLSASLSSFAFADEGYWLFNHLPVEKIESRYGFKPSDSWVENVMKSSVRFGGASGGFISGTGLALTNHHVAGDTLQKISTPQNDYFQNGFYARTQAEEKPAPDLEVNALDSIEEVTARVNASVTAGMTDEQAAAARRATIAQIEKESTDRTQLKSTVVKFFNGGQYHLYRYKVYRDVRLVFAPEYAAASFGGDPDNFEFPRFDLDMAIFRVYENNRPAQIDHYLRWSMKPTAEGELVFTSGNPGGTDRQRTVSALRNLRDRVLVFSRDLMFRREILLQQFLFRGPEQERRAHQLLISVQNSRKVFQGQLAALDDPKLIQSKLAQENRVRQEVSTRPELAPFAGAWDRIEASENLYAGVFKPYQLVERAGGFYSSLFTIARHLVRIAAEDRLPNSERLPEYQSQARASLEQQLFSSAPIYEDLEIAKLTDSLMLLVETLGGDNAFVRKVLGDLSPADRAAQLVFGTRLKSVDVRRELALGGGAAIATSDDPFIQLALAIDEDARVLRKQVDSQVTEVENQAYAQISNASFAVYGSTQYPDGTSTPRLSYGVIQGYPQEGQLIDAITTLGGAFGHEKNHSALEPWKLPASWHSAQGALRLDTPLNFANTSDTYGGNSGSPVVNRDGELVGLNFDRNRHGLGRAYQYREGSPERAIAVHSAGMLEALRKIYGADALANEIEQASAAPEKNGWGALIRLLP